MRTSLSAITVAIMLAACGGGGTDTTTAKTGPASGAELPTVGGTAAMSTGCTADVARKQAQLQVLLMCGDTPCMGNTGSVSGNWNTGAIVYGSAGGPTGSVSGNWGTGVVTSGGGGGGSQPTYNVDAYGVRLGTCAPPIATAASAPK